MMPILQGLTQEINNLEFGTILNIEPGILIG